MAKGYFSNFPTIQYPYYGKIVNREGEESNFVDTVECVDAMLRFKIKGELYESPTAFYDWKWRSGDRPDRIAELYYGDSRYAWVVMYSALTFSAHFDLPMTERELQERMLLTYSFVRVQTPVPAFWEGEKILQYAGDEITFEGRFMGQSNGVLVLFDTKGEIDLNFDLESQDSILTVTPTSFPANPAKFAALQSVQFDAGVSLYQYEVNKNETNRTIKLLNRNLLSKFLEDFRNQIRAVENVREKSKIPLILGGREDRLI